MCVRGGVERGQEFKQFKQNAKGRRLSADLWLILTWSLAQSHVFKMISCRDFFVSLERDMGTFQGDTVDTRRKATLGHLIQEFLQIPMMPRHEATLGTWAPAFLPLALCLHRHRCSYRWLPGIWGILILLESQVATISSSTESCGARWAAELANLERGHQSVESVWFPHLYDQQEEITDQTQVHILRMNR